MRISKNPPRGAKPGNIVSFAPCGIHTAPSALPFVLGAFGLFILFLLLIASVEKRFFISSDTADVYISSTVRGETTRTPMPGTNVFSASDELPPPMLGAEVPFLRIGGAFSAGNILGDPSWKEFVKTEAERSRKAQGRPSIIETVLPKNANEAVAMNVFSLYSYIREVNPGLSPNSALIQACSILHYSGECGLPVSLVVGVAQTESNFRPEAVSSANARGVMQVMWKYHSRELSVRGISSENGLHDPEYGIMAGTLVLSKYMKNEQSMAGALARYYGTLSERYTGITLAHKHAYELYSSGISENWRNSLAREREYWGRLTSGTPSSSGSSAPGGTPKKSVAAKPPVTTRSVLSTRPSGGTTTPAPTSGGNLITVVYRSGERKTWTD